jgi:hypothetical protein
MYSTAERARSKGNDVPNHENHQVGFHSGPVDRLTLRVLRLEIRTSGGCRDLPGRRHLYTTGDPVTGILLGYRIPRDCGSFHATLAHAEDLALAGLRLHCDARVPVGGIPNTTSPGRLKEIMKKLTAHRWSNREARAVLILAICMTIPVAGIAQISVTGIAPTSVTEITPIPVAPTAATSVIGTAPLDWQGKLQFHAEATYGPWAIASFAAYAGLLQEINSPTEWGQGAGAYGKRFASTLGWSAIHSTLAFGLDSTLHQDPRYYRSRSTGFWRRSGHALRGTILTRTDAGGETLSTWRIGSAYGAAFLSDLWYPSRLNTFRQGFVDGSLGLGLGFASNLGSEFWPDIKSKVFHRKVWTP